MRELGWGFLAQGTIQRMREQTPTFEGAHPIAWIRATAEHENLDRHHEAIERLLEIAKRYGFPMPTRDVVPIRDQPFLAEMDIEIHAGPRDLIAPYLFVVSSGSISPSPVRPPKHSTMLALHGPRSGGLFTLFSPVPEWVSEHPDNFMRREHGMRIESDLSLDDAADLIENHLADPLPMHFWRRS